MSLFLGYIHNLMYEKILFQEKLLTSLLDLADEDEKISLRNDLDK